MRRLHVTFVVMMVAFVYAAAVAAEQRTVVVAARDRDYRETLVTVEVTPPANFTAVTVTLGKKPVAAQWERIGKRLAVTWPVRSLRKGDKQVYTITFQQARAQSLLHAAVKVGNDVELRLGGQLFARYDATTGPNKPFFHPVFAPGQKQVVRGFPVATRPGETQDHPHHQGLWFTHGSVNGEDFWARTDSRTVNTGYSLLVSGPVYCGFTATTSWVSKTGTTIARDTRTFRAYTLLGSRILDVTIRLTPVDGPVVLGDTKEGSFGLRLADSMRLRGGDGHIVNSEGLTDGATWGKRAAWVDYYGTVEGATVGVAILDHPSSFRHPTWWHVRDYGLFAVNPFGIHDFEPGKEPTAGNAIIPVGGALVLRYRLVFHQGTTPDARISDLWAEFAEPPVVTVR